MIVGNNMKGGSMSTVMDLLKEALMGLAEIAGAIFLVVSLFLIYQLIFPQDAQICELINILKNW